MQTSASAQSAQSAQPTSKRLRGIANPPYALGRWPSGRTAVVGPEGLILFDYSQSAQFSPAHSHSSRSPVNSEGLILFDYSHSVNSPLLYHTHSHTSRSHDQMPDSRAGTLTAAQSDSP
ncbi:Protein of unknown function [Pyronema omphalodes CBS 100304]|uniref:Uncharacterized protein n=1 Tax=Pyronema omphalodes (strain CBS 100304) TaxID=1076935 RepID=U4L6P5_PYROM|nr:Protein of unknown function [Pyronema omphalodes CBS 100304]